MKTITINGTNYVAKDFDFNMVCDLQDMGIDISGGAKMPLIRAYVAACMNTDKETAGKELEKHIVASGNVENALTPIVEMIAEKLGESDFFRALSKETEKDVAKKATAKK